MSELYTNAHLFVAAVKVLTHIDHAPPSIERVAEMLSFSIEQTGFISRKLVDTGAIEIVEGNYGTRIFVKDHLKLEELPQQQEENKLDAELKKFKESRKEIDKKIESIKTEQEQRRKDLFAELQQKFKQGVNPKTDKDKKD